MNKNRTLNYCDLDNIDYKEAWDLQKAVLDLRADDKVEDVLFLLEHPHTYTLGKVADKNNLIGSKEYLEKNKISVYDIDRGGDITYHGPGQIVGYPIIDLQKWKMDTHKYLRGLEEVIIKTCAEYGIKGTRNPEYTGVWIVGCPPETRDRKIAAIGIKVSRWITMHGFAFNIDTDLDFFAGIIPCGISDKGVTSLNKETNEMVTISEVKNKLLNNFKEVFEYNGISAVTREELMAANLSN